MTSPRDHLGALQARVDAFFEKVHARFPQDMQCKPGCTACCISGLTVTLVEAAAIQDALDALPDDLRAHLARAAGHKSPACPALLDDGKCAIYAARPLVCRSHGVPIKLKGRLPVIQSCELNFTSGGPENAPGEFVLDQETLSTVLLAIDAAFSKELDEEPGQRIPLRALLG